MNGSLSLLQLWLNVIYTVAFIAPSVIPDSNAPHGASLVPLTRPIWKEDYVTAFRTYDSST